MEEVTNSLLNIFLIQNNTGNDKRRMISYLLELSKLKKDNNFILKNYLISLFENTNIIPTEKKLKKYKDKLQKKFHFNFNTFVNLFKIWDTNSSGVITLGNLEKIFDSMNMSLKIKYYKFMIHLMKKNCQSLNLGIEDLQYKFFIEQISSPERKSSEELSEKFENKEAKEEINENTISNCNGRGENGLNIIEIIEELGKDNSHIGRTLQDDSNEDIEEEDVVITMKEFDQTVDRILQKFAEFLINNKKSVRDFFSNKIISIAKSPSFTTDAIPLKDFVIELNQINIEMNTIDVYCIFTKLKMSEDDDEIIEVAKLCDEMLNYGIFDENTNNVWNGNTSLKKSETSEYINFKSKAYSKGHEKENDQEYSIN